VCVRESCELRSNDHPIVSMALERRSSRCLLSLERRTARCLMALVVVFLSLACADDTGGQWTVCAVSERKMCHCEGTVIYGLRFAKGVPGSGEAASLAQTLEADHREKQVSGSVTCSNGVFGDPLRGVSKHCLCNARDSSSTGTTGTCCAWATGGKTSWCDGHCNTWSSGWCGETASNCNNGCSGKFCVASRRRRGPTASRPTVTPTAYPTEVPTNTPTAAPTARPTAASEGPFSGWYCLSRDHCHIDLTLDSTPSVRYKGPLSGAGASGASCTDVCGPVDKTCDNAASAVVTSAAVSRLHVIFYRIKHKRRDCRSSTASTPTSPPSSAEGNAFHANRLRRVTTKRCRECLQQGVCASNGLQGQVEDAPGNTPITSAFAAAWRLTSWLRRSAEARRQPTHRPLAQPQPRHRQCATMAGLQRWELVSPWGSAVRATRTPSEGPARMILASTG